MPDGTSLGRMALALKEVAPMRLLTRLVAGGGVAAFFFFSWIIMMLWNSIVAGHLALYKSLSYLQACGLWLLVILLFAWAGIGAGWRFILGWHRERRREEFGREIENKIRCGLARWVGAEKDVEWDELGDKFEKRIKSKFKQWLAEDDT